MEAVRITIETSLEILEKMAEKLDELGIPMPIKTSAVVKNGKSKFMVSISFDDLVVIMPVLASLAVVVESAKTFNSAMNTLRFAADNLKEEDGDNESKVFLNDEEIQPDDLDELIDFSVPEEEE